MAISYEKLYKLMEERGLIKFWLHQNGINPKVADALYKGANANASTTMQLCSLLRIQPGDIMECVPDAASGPRQ